MSVATYRRRDAAHAASAPPRHASTKDSPVNGTSAPVFRLMSDS